MLGFNGSLEAKEALQVQVEAHFLADEITQGVYWENGKGCALGCMTHNSRHEDGAKLLGLPLSYVRLMDRIFENLPNETAKSFPGQVVDAIQLDRDYTQITDRFLLALLADPERGTRRLCKSERSQKVTDDVIALYRRRLDGDEPTQDEWIKARRAAWAAEAAAQAAAEAAAQAAAEAAAQAAAAQAAAWAAAQAAAQAAAAEAAAQAQAANIWQAELFVRLLKEAA